MAVLPLLLAASALGGDRWVVWVRSPAPPDVDLEALRADIAGAFRDGGLPEPLFVSVVPPRGDNGAEPDKARRFLERAREEYRRFEHQAALASLTSARAAVAVACDPAAQELLTAIELLNGLIHLAASERERAEEAFGRIFVWNPDYSPDEKMFSPKIVALIEKARAQALARPGASLALNVLPAGARPALDGRDIEMTGAPVSVPAGEHCLSVVRPGFESWRERLVLEPGAALVRRIVLPPEPESVEGAGDARPAAARRLAQQYGVDGMIWIEDRTKMASVVFARADSDVSDGFSECAWADAARCLAGEFGRHRAPRPPAMERPPVSTSLPVPAPGPAPAVAVESARPWYERWWFWTSLGAAVAAGAALGLAVALSGDEPGYRIILGRP